VAAPHAPRPHTHPVAEKLDDDEAGRDDRQRTAGRDASQTPETPESRLRSTAASTARLRRVLTDHPAREPRARFALDKALELRRAAQRRLGVARAVAVGLGNTRASGAARVAVRHFGSRSGDRHGGGSSA